MEEVQIKEDYTKMRIQNQVSIKKKIDVYCHTPDNKDV